MAKWATREHPKTDRIACPWLIRHFIDPEAEFIYVPADEVLEVAEREGAHSYDAPGAEYTHRDRLCSFEVLVEEYEIADPAGLTLSLSVNGEPRQKANTRDLVLGFGTLVELASSFYTLLPGDIILTGTPEGVGPVRPGDVMEAAIDGIGQMRVEVRAA